VYKTQCESENLPFSSWIQINEYSIPEIKVEKGIWRHLAVSDCAENGTLVSDENKTETKLPIPVSAENKNGPKLANRQVRRSKTKMKSGRSLVCYGMIWRFNSRFSPRREHRSHPLVHVQTRAEGSTYYRLSKQIKWEGDKPKGEQMSLMTVWIVKIDWEKRSGRVGLINQFLSERQKKRSDDPKWCLPPLTLIFLFLEFPHIYIALISWWLTWLTGSTCGGSR